MSTVTLSQISCFSSINRGRKLCLLGKSSSFVVVPPIRFKFSVYMHIDSNHTQSPTSETDASFRYGGDVSRLHVDGAVKSYPGDDEHAENVGMDEPIHEQGVASHKKTAKIHDFCLGIPFGGIVLSGGLVGSLFSKNLMTLGVGVLFGGSLLALSTFSLKVWKQGKSSLPFILGQAALSAVLLWKYLPTYTMTKTVFPAGFYALVSAAMLCFYFYVLASGGNPPPKKLKDLVTAMTAWTLCLWGQCVQHFALALIYVWKGNFASSSIKISNYYMSGRDLIAITSAALSLLWLRAQTSLRSGDDRVTTLLEMVCGIPWALWGQSTRLLPPVIRITGFILKHTHTYSPKYSHQLEV
ncbi:Fatty acid export 1 protein [Thalictrum thalictroides]|uniref:Fatty acid export 1 protein n=1 Tax=Thalictrum thalictroides TaxID=46969 RepID=A0A7J6VH09_THATH|nr:Fatty acid export 1 protein [Thalictrum thalictroides]